LTARVVGNADQADQSAVFAGAGPLEVRLATNQLDIEAAQTLRYRVFYEEMSARPTPDVAAKKRDADEFDAVCDHLLVVDTRKESDAARGVVGTYRVLRRGPAEKFGRFYSESEYDISNIVAHGGEILELGRSCVDAAYRTGATMQLLWQAIAAYVFRHDIEVMFGCASLPGTDVDALALPLSYLYQWHLAPPALRARALPERYVSMSRVPVDDLDKKAALASLPPLIKGYLRLGGFVGDGAVIDDQFNTTDVCIIVKTDLVTDKYSRHYERKRREAAPG
jgi:putative hemolysin